MKTTLSVLLALLLLATPLAVLGAAQEDEVEIERDLQVEITQGSTERFGGGDWVRVDVGSTTFAVLYGNETTPNFPTVYAEYDRYLGAAEVYNETGELVHDRTPLPVRTILAQRFYFALEFKDVDGDSLAHIPRHLTPADILLGSTDLPRKLLMLDQTWELEELRNETSEDGLVTTVDFNITARDLDYTVVGPFDEPGDGLDRITLAFHLTVSLEETQVDVTVYRFTVSDDREIIAFEKDTETMTGMTVNGSWKYDHYIEGWDFADEDSRLALATQVFAGVFVPPKVQAILHLEFALQALEDGDAHDEREGWERPVLLTGDELSFEDEWERVGHVRWASDVVVDDVLMEMYFQLHRAERISWHGFSGVLFNGAFIYPQGNVIFHDPALDAAVFVPGGQLVGGGETPLNLGPYFVQAAVAGIVIVGLVVFRTLRRKPQ